MRKLAEVVKEKVLARLGLEYLVLNPGRNSLFGELLAQVSARQ